MKKISLIIALVLSACSPEIYLSGIGEVVKVSPESVTVAFPCSNVKRPDCFAAAIYDRKDFDFPYIGQKVKLESYVQIPSNNGSRSAGLGKSSTDPK